MRLTPTDRNVPATLLSGGLEPAPRWTRFDYLLAGALVAVGLALRIPGLNQGLWIDEIETLVSYVRAPVAQIIQGAGGTNNHVLYSLIAHYAVHWLGESAWVVRLPAVVFGVAAIPALYYFGRQVAGRQEAFLAASFMALNYQYVWYSQNARGYTGLLFGALLASILFIRLLATTRPSARLIVGYAVVAALSAWINVTALFVVLAHGLVWLALVYKSKQAERFAVAFPAFLALFLTGVLTLALYAPTIGATLAEAGTAQDVVGGFDVEQVKWGPNPYGQMTWVMREYAQGLQQSIPGGWPVVVIVAFVLIAGAALVPAAWQPKQDFVAAAQFIQDHRALGDGVICLTHTVTALQKFLGMDCEPVHNLAELIKIEAQYEQVWLLYTLPSAMQSYAPGILPRIQQPQDYATVKVFPGILNGGDIIVLRKQATLPGASSVPDAES